MKNSIIAIIAIGAIGFASAIPAPAGGFYPSPTWPGGFGGDLIPPMQMCNCNNPSKKEYVVQPFCTQAGGRDDYRLFLGAEEIRQRVCILSKALSGEVFTNAECQKEFGEGYKSFCTNATP
ncbi:hypothetical protein QBC34DRAFT_469243 [Podospora aff. communis PSN243]|uniref:Uncharacterized protein n=1 Tax=Podospora aff. communis PSN243 TaxID=3040156 RepID=A0AAV9GEQ3_9PEZI|nr:hypothetical protein QBC34DRAFT_469243 [Podospora aff. communis PSN243]